ncbi:MAG: hypothetical protein GY765_33890 [bacterium]|nr:hypothetical protein [bacterium]
MKYLLEERIGNPDLFTGRKKELAHFLKWINDIKEKKSQSTAILARRKMGKTALLERLFNITFHNNEVIPFYYEVKEKELWVVDFCIDFCMTFVYQYIAFKTRKREYLEAYGKADFSRAKQTAVKEGLDYLVELIEGIENAVANEHVDILWEIARNAPKTLAFRQQEFIVQMIDEFQFLNAMIYRDREMKIPIKDFAGGYLSTAESKIAPLLVSGSWVGWLMNLLKMMLPSRFKYNVLENMPEDEAAEMVFKYSRFFDVPVCEETVYLLARLSEGSPFYISAVMRSEYPDKNLTTIEGLTRTLEFETLDPRGTIKSGWMEYVKAAFGKVNDRNAKRIVLHLFKQKDRELTRKEILEDLELEMTDEQLEERLEALVKGDIIDQGMSNYRYRAVADNVFDKVFRGVYQDEIEHFDGSEIRKEYEAAFNTLKKQYYRLQGKYNHQKGYFAEFLILNRLKYHGREHNVRLKSLTRNLPGDFDFCEYSRVWRYDAAPEYRKEFNVDIFARALPAARDADVNPTSRGEAPTPSGSGPAGYSIIGEVKSRESKKFSKEEVTAFERKFAAVKKMEKVERAVAFIYSRCGFTAEAEAYCHKQGIAVSEDEGWLES